MYVITVIPISRGIGKENLSYFTASDVEPGSLVSVPLRKKMVDGLVVRSVDAREMKAELRSADFALRKIDCLVSRPFLPAAFMKTVEETARWHGATVGAVLKIMLKSSRDNAFSRADPPPKASGDPHVRKSIVSGTLEQRIEAYQDHHGSMVILVPTKERQMLFRKLFTCPVLLPSEIVSIPQNTELIIIEEATSQAYKSISRPFIDFRYAIKKYAEFLNASIIEGTESLDHDVKKAVEEHIKEDTKPFNSIGKHLEKELLGLKDAIEAHAPRHLFILATRRGHSGTVLCQDCGLAVHCERCEAPLTLHMKGAKEDFNNLICHHCGFKRTALTKCTRCNSWRLKAFGLGVEKVEEDVKAFVKKHGIQTYVQRIDSTLKLTPKKIRDFVKTHYEKETAVLIGTEIILPYLADAALEGHKNRASYIASLDTLLSLPDFSISEKIWKLLCLLDNVTERRVVVQTRDAKNALLKKWKENDEKGFWKEELEACKTFNYPPHGTFIKITLKGRKERIAEEMREIQMRLSKWKPMVFPAFIKSVNNQHILHALITLQEGKWVDEELLEQLLMLSPSVRVEVNPRSLL